MIGRLGYLAAGILLGIVLLQATGQTSPMPYPEIIVPAARIIEREAPARPPTIVERIVYVNVQPELRAEAPGGALEDVQAFCRPVSPVDTDTVRVPDPMFLIRSGAWHESWLGRDELRLAGPTNAGDLLEYTYRSRGSFDFRTDGDSVLVRYGRLNVVRDWFELGSQLFTIYHVIKATTGVLP